MDLFSSDIVASPSLVVISIGHIVVLLVSLQLMVAGYRSDYARNNWLQATAHSQELICC